MNATTEEQAQPFQTSLNRLNNNIVEDAHFCMNFPSNRSLVSSYDDKKVGEVLSELADSVRNIIFARDLNSISSASPFSINLQELEPLLPLYKDIIQHLNKKDFEQVRQLMTSDKLAGVDKYPFLFVSFLASDLPKGHENKAIEADTLKLLSEYALPKHRFARFVSRTFYTNINKFMRKKNRDFKDDPIAQCTYQYLLQQSETATSLQEVALIAKDVSSAFFLPAFKAAGSEEDAETSIMLDLLDKAQDAMLSEDLTTPQQSVALSSLAQIFSSHFIASPDEREQLTALNSHLIMNKDAFSLCGTQIHLIGWMKTADEEKGEVYTRQLLAGMTKQNAPVSGKVFARCSPKAFGLLPRFDEAAHEACVSKTCEIIKRRDFDQLYVSEQKDLVKLAAKTLKGLTSVSKALLNAPKASEKIEIIVYGGVQCVKSTLRRLAHLQP